MDSTPASMKIRVNGAFRLLECYFCLISAWRIGMLSMIRSNSSIPDRVPGTLFLAAVLTDQHDRKCTCVLLELTPHQRLFFRRKRMKRESGRVCARRQNNFDRHLPIP